MNQTRTWVQKKFDWDIPSKHTIVEESQAADCKILLWGRGVLMSELNSVSLVKY